jgi:hypothetical protein
MTHFQRRCCLLNANADLAIAAEIIAALGPRVLRALLAELIAGRDPEAAIAEYASITAAKYGRAVKALDDRRAPQ